MTRRECWPPEVYIFRRGNEIRRVDLRFPGSTRWEPTHADILADDWENIKEINPKGVNPLR